MSLGVEASTQGTGSNIDDRLPEPRIERQCIRAVKLMNIAEGTKIADIVRVIRGGRLLDVFVRPQERTASVSFVHQADAQLFYAHVRKHDLYINNKRVRAITSLWQAGP